MAVARGRGPERGAALFIVMMVIVLLSAVGVYAVRASSLLEMASGYGRKATQAMYIAEFGNRLMAADIAGKESAYDGNISSGNRVCRANANLVVQPGNAKPCDWKSGAEMESQVVNYSTALNLSDSNVQGLLGRIIRSSQSATAEAGFVVEMTDIGPAHKPKAGTDVNSENFKHRQITFTTTGHVRPAGGACTADTIQASSVQGIRSHVTYMTR